MTDRFVDVYLPGEVPGYPCASSPRWATEIVTADSGAEGVNQRWTQPLHKFTLPEAVRDMTTFNAIRDHWLVMRGPLHTFPWRDPLDFASCSLVAPNTEPISPYPFNGLNQLIGTGDGSTTEFQLVKTYQRAKNTGGYQEFTRTITLPVLSSVIVTVGGGEVTNYTVSRPGGVITFDTAPLNGEIIKAGYLFDVEVRFESDEAFDGIVQAIGLGGFADITLIETRRC